MKTKLLILIVFALTISGIFAKANAQETIRTFTVSPPAVEVSLDPGKKSEGIIKIVNDGETPLTFKTSVQDFIVTDDDGTPTILPPDTLANKYSGASWVAIYPDTVTVQPHQKAQLNYYLQVPLDARPGGHYAAVMYTPTNSVGVSGTGAAVNTSVGTLLYITVNGPVTIQAKLNKFFTQGIWDFGPVTLNTQILNQSDVHIHPVGVITLTNMLGQTSDTKPLAGYNIFPGVSRNYQTSVGKKLMLGVYKASLRATYGPNQNVLLATTSFVVFPWKIAIFVILLVIAVSLGYRYWKKGDRRNEPHTPENHGETLSNQ